MCINSLVRKLWISLCIIIFGFRTRNGASRRTGNRNKTAWWRQSSNWKDCRKQVHCSFSRQNADLNIGRNFAFGSMEGATASKHTNWYSLSKPARSHKMLPFLNSKQSKFLFSFSPPHFKKFLRISKFCVLLLGVLWLLCTYSLF